MGDPVLKRDWGFMVAMEYNLSLLVIVGIVHATGARVLANSVLRQGTPKKGVTRGCHLAAADRLAPPVLIAREIEGYLPSMIFPVFLWVHVKLW